MTRGDQIAAAHPSVNRYQSLRPGAKGKKGARDLSPSRALLLGGIANALLSLFLWGHTPLASSCPLSTIADVLFDVVGYCTHIYSMTMPGSASRFLGLFYGLRSGGVSL